MKHKPNPSITTRITTRDFPLADNLVYSSNPEGLAVAEWKRCLSLLEDKVPHVYNQNTLKLEQLYSQYMATASMIKPRELPHAEELEQLAKDVIIELYDIPPHLVLNPNITETNDAGKPDDIAPGEVSQERQVELADEVQKRIILNGLVHGSSMHIWKTAIHLMRDRIKELNPLLMDLYENYIAITSTALWLQPPNFITMNNEMDMMSMLITQGKEQVIFEEEGQAAAEIQATAVNLPVLLHELNKGVIDYLITRGIPSDLNENELQWLYGQADSYEDESWHYLLSPSVWNNLMTVEKISTTQIPGLIKDLCLMDLETLSTYLINTQPDERN